ncbi:MAG: HAMP domain-containing histidine kinase [Candidatus Eremiobacteraeota bacterium]|nr:HAMP domain-containing histidine kinase [Candidatus Eremiobacteraeota bacterium]
MHSPADFEPLLASAHDAVPLIVLRIPEFERIAWRQGLPAARSLERRVTRAFCGAAQKLLRQDDQLGHEIGSDVFMALMFTPSRQDRNACALDCRASVERLATAVLTATGLTAQTGWSILRKTEPTTSLHDEVVAALERGARERERFEFFASVGHELRTPLSSICGYLETILDEQVDSQTTRRFLEITRREALRLSRLIEGMFEFSLLDLSSDQLLGSRSELGACITSAVEAVRPLAAGRKITIQVGQLADTTVGLHADACIQALINLLENAGKFGRIGGTVRISSREEAGWVTITVDDDGPGVCRRDRAAVFDHRVRGSRADRPGNGIGLAIVRMIVERAGGSVGIEQSSLGGARFQIELPKRAEMASAMS